MGHLPLTALAWALQQHYPDQGATQQRLGDRGHLGTRFTQFTYALLTNEHAQPHDLVRGPKGKSSCIHLLMGSYPRRHDAHLQPRTIPPSMGSCSS